MYLHNKNCESDFYNNQIIYPRGYVLIFYTLIFIPVTSMMYINTEKYMVKHKSNSCTFIGKSLNKSSHIIQRRKTNFQVHLPRNNDFISNIECG